MKSPSNGSGESFHTASAGSTVSRGSHIEDATQAIAVPGSEDTAKAFAERAWQEDPSFVEREKLVEWLGSPSEIRHQALAYYIAHFEFGGSHIDDAIRQLCNKLYIKGETQQMDRVLEAFSEHYVTQNAASIWRIADIVHVVSFAIILFDTGLQSTEFNTPTISRWFVESTIEAIRAQLQQGSILKQNGTLKNLLTNSTLASDPLPDIDGSGQLHFSTSPSGKPESLASVNIDRRPSSRGSRTSRDSWIITQSWDTGEPQFGERWFTDISRELSAIYSRIQAKPILQTCRYKDTAASPQSRSESRAIFLSTLGRRVSSSMSSLPQFLGITSNQLLQPYASNDLTKWADSRWAKSGPLLWKPMKPTTGRIAKPKRWLTIIATVRDSIFDMSGPVTPGNSGAAGRRLGALSLLHSLAIEFPTPKGTKVRSFGLTLASGETHVFEIQAPEGVFSKSKSKRRADPDAEVSAWVRACNYHAARYSRAPLPNAVTNAEYGWNGVTEVDDGQDSTKGHARNVVIEDWVAPNLPAMEAQTDVEAQFGVWRKQVDIYNLEFAKHSELRGKMMSLYRPGSAEAYKALSNWEKKSQYLLTEMVKYDTYAEFLQYHWCEEYSVNNSSSCYNNISGSVHIDPAIQPSYDASVASDAELTSPSSPASDECETSAPQSLIRDITVGNSPHEALYENLPRSDHDGSQCSNETKDDQQSYSPQYMAFTMYECLVQHGCPDLTSLIDPLGFSSSPVAEGGFGDVWTGKYRDSNTKLAIKVLRFSLSMGYIAKKEGKRTAREIYSWSKLDHENVNKLLGITIFRERLGMVSEWMENGNLRQYIRRNNDVNRHELCIQIARGVSYLHGLNMVHGDLKGCNILVSSTGVAKITDFDYSIFPECSLAFSATTRMGGGTLRWMAPELIINEHPPQRNTKTDIYALGMTFLETMTGSHPYSEYGEHQLYFKLANKEHPKRSKEHFPETDKGGRMWSILLQCWDFDPTLRPTADQILASLSYFQTQVTDTP